MGFDPFAYQGGKAQTVNNFTGQSGASYRKLQGGQWMGPNGITVSDPNQYEKMKFLRGAMADPTNYEAGQDYSSIVAPYLSGGGGGVNTAAAGSALNNLVAMTGAAPDRHYSDPNQFLNRTYTNQYENRLQRLLDNPDAIQNTGVYKFAFNQGNKAIERSAAAKGNLSSGNTLAALMAHAQGLASQTYGSEADRLAGLTKQQNDFIIGSRGADAAMGKVAADYNVGMRNSDANLYNATSGRMNSLTDLLAKQDSSRVSAGQLALDAAKAKSNDYWKKFEMANTAGTGSGYYNRNNGLAW